MIRDISRLCPAETIAFDHGRLAAVCDRYGHRSEAYIAFVLSEVEALVRTAAHQQGDPSGLRRSCGDLIRLCDTIGMVTLATAGHAVLDCLDRPGGIDAPALGACIARLFRLGQQGANDGWTLGHGAGRPEIHPADRGAMPDTVA